MYLYCIAQSLGGSLGTEIFFFFKNFKLFSFINKTVKRFVPEIYFMFLKPI